MLGIITNGTVVEDNPAFLMKRAFNTAGADITIASISTITYTIHDTADGTEVVAQTSLTVADVVFDTLQITDAWLNAGGEADGYNVGAELPGSGWATPGQILQIQATVTPVSGSVFPLIWRVSVLPWFGS